MRSSRRCRTKAATLSGAARKTLDDKIAVVKKMVAFSRSRCRTPGRSTKSSPTPPQGWALHAMVLDIDVGPHLQTHKLLTSVIFARQKGYSRPLTAAELEMMNLTGDGTGLDMVTMPQAMREQVPTANFFQRGGYERNPVASRHNTVAKLLAVTDSGWTSTATSPARSSWRGRFSAVTLSPCGKGVASRSEGGMRGLSPRTIPLELTPVARGQRPPIRRGLRSRHLLPQGTRQAALNSPRT